MATGNLGVDEGTTKFLATNTISEDAITKHLGRSVISKSDGTELGTVSNPVVMSGVVNGVVQTIPQGITTISGTVGGTINAIVQNAGTRQWTLASGTDNVNVGNFPTSQTVNGQVNIGNFPNNTSVSGVVLMQGGTAGAPNTIKDAATYGDGLSSGVMAVHPELYRTGSSDYARWPGDGTNGAFVQVKNTVTTSGTIGGTIQSVVQNFPNVTASGVQHTVVDNFPTVQNVTENNSSAILAKLPAQGQSTMSASQPVAIASDQTPFPTYRATTTYSGTQALPAFRTFANVTASQTDSSIVSAITGKIIRVVASASQAGGTATALTFNSKGGGAGTAISMTFQNGINGGEVLNENLHGWFQTNVGEGLTATTGAGSTTGIQITYVVI